MIKWSEFSEGDSLFEAFLPEHDHESCAWLLRWSRNGHIIEERRIRLTWPPRFGPDAGDVAQIEAVLDTLIARLPAQQPLQSRGDYIPEPFSPLPSSPEVLAALAICLAEFVKAEASLGLNPEETRRFLRLPDRAKADGFYPMKAVPPLSIRRMSRQWGSCSPQGRISLNVGLVRVPRECIDYVLLHELIHLKVHNHGPAFYRILDRQLPDWKRTKARLDALADLALAR